MLGELGRGGTAVVYLARDRELGRKVAIKVIRATYIEDDEAAARLKREAQTIAGLQHPNLVMLYGTRRLRDRSLALVMQYIEGHTLKSEVQRRGPLPFERVVQVLTDIARGLSYAHAHRIVHRDIKPENIYIDDETGIARLSDFGIARPWGMDSNLTLPGSAIGTPAYMSPEQIDGGVLDGRSDLYSLGLVGHEMLTGARPWAGETLFSIIMKQKHEELPSLAQARPGIPSELRQAIEGATRKRPDRRWRDADALLAVLAEVDVASISEETPPAPLPIAQHNTAEADPGAKTVKYNRTAVALETIELADQETRAGEISRSRASRRWSQVGVLAITVIAVAMGAWMVLSPGTSSPSEQPRDVTVAAEPGTEATQPVTVEPAAEPESTVRTPTSARALYGERQTGLVGDTLPEPLVLRVEDGAGKPLAGVTVRFAVVRGEGVAHPDRAVTDESGAATSQWLPLAPGEHAIDARVDGIAETVPFRARVLARAQPSETVVPKTTPAVEPARTNTPAAPAGTPVPIRRTVALGGTHTCSLGGDGVATCWGGNENGQLGDGSLTRRPQAVRVAAPEALATIGGGVTHSCAVGVSGSVFCWGSNSSGQLGDGTRTSRSLPVRARIDARLVTVAVGAAHSCALDGGGKLFCWGQNTHGQLGDGTQTDRTQPVRAGGARTFRSVVVGWAHTCALSLDGAAFCWGRNGAGELGDGGTRDRAEPAPVTGAFRFSALAAGSAHTCGLLTSGSIRCWGQNSHGQLGNGTTTASPTPVRVAAQESFVAVAVGGVHSCGLTRDGVAQCWGRNTYGQLGDGTVEDRPRPAPVAGTQRFTALYANAAHSCASASGAALYCWGFNLEGQLGDATRSNQLQPVPVGSQD